MKKTIIGIIIGGIIFGSIGVLGATYLYHANEVSYTPSNSEFNVDNVDEAINELYDLSNNIANSSDEVVLIEKYHSADQWGSYWNFYTTMYDFSKKQVIGSLDYRATVSSGNDTISGTTMDVIRQNNIVTIKAKVKGKFMVGSNIVECNVGDEIFSSSSVEAYERYLISLVN